MLCDVGGSWLGGIVQSRQAGAAAILLVLRWFMLNNIRAAALTETYDRFVITRSDFYFPCPHPPLQHLDQGSLWVPDGEDYGGICDRHLVVSAADLVASSNLIDDLLLHPHQMREAMIRNVDWNIEQVLAFHLVRNGLATKVKRFPYVMFLVRAPGDPTAHSVGYHSAEVGMTVKQRTELNEANRYRQLIRSNDDWRLYFAAQHFPDLFPARIYSTHGTVLYVDEVTGELRHGPLADSPKNVFFVIANSIGRIVHRSGDRVYDTVHFVDHSRSASVRIASAGQAPEPTAFERVRIQKGYGPDRSFSTNNLTGLRARNLHLCAESDGRVTLSRPHCHVWEHFRLIPDFRERVTFHAHER